MHDELAGNSNPMWRAISADDASAFSAEKAHRQ